MVKGTHKQNSAKKPTPRTQESAEPKSFSTRGSATWPKPLRKIRSEPSWKSKPMKRRNDSHRCLSLINKSWCSKKWSTKREPKETYISNKSMAKEKGQNKSSKVALEVEEWRGEYVEIATSGRTSIRSSRFLWRFIRTWGWKQTDHASPLNDREIQPHHVILRQKL